MTLFHRRWARYGLTAFLLLLVTVKIHPARLGETVASVRPPYVAGAAALTVPFLYLKILRWHWMLHAASIPATWLESSLSLIGGMGPALVTPARLGEVMRAAFLRDPRKLEIGGLVLIDKGFDVIVLTGLSIVGAWQLIGPLAGMALFVVVCAGLVVIYFPRHLSASVNRMLTGAPIGAKISRVVSSAEALTVRSTSAYLALTFASFGFVMLQFGLILSSWRPWSLDIVLLTFPLVILTNVLPVTIGGLGVREGTAALLLSHYGVPASEATVAALLSATMNTYVPGFVGALLVPAAPGRSVPPTVPTLDKT